MRAFSRISFKLISLQQTAALQSAQHASSTACTTNADPGATLCAGLRTRYCISYLLLGHEGGDYGDRPVGNSQLTRVQGNSQQMKEVLGNILPQLLIGPLF